MQSPDGQSDTHDVPAKGYYIHCRQCGELLRIQHKLLGSAVACRFCQKPFRLKWSKLAKRLRAVYADCPHCDQEIKASVKYLGQKVACKHCSAKLVMILSEPKDHAASATVDATESSETSQPLSLGDPQDDLFETQESEFDPDEIPHRPDDLEPDDVTLIFDEDGDTDFLDALNDDHRDEHPHQKSAEPSVLDLGMDDEEKLVQPGDVSEFNVSTDSPIESQPAETSSIFDLNPEEGFGGPEILDSAEIENGADEMALDGVFDVGDRTETPSELAGSEDETTQTEPVQQDEWFCEVFGITLGPMPLGDLRARVTAGEVGDEDRVRCGNDGEWVAAGTLSELFPHQSPIGLNDHKSEEESLTDVSADESEDSPIDHVSPDVPHRVGPSVGPHRPGVVDEERSAPEPVAAASIPSRSGESSGNVSQIGGLAAEIAAEMELNSQEEPGRGKSRLAFGRRMRWGRQKWIGAAVISLLAVGALYFWMYKYPNRECYETFLAVWEEHRQLRDRRADAATWAEFDKRSRETIAPLVAELKRTATARRKIRQELLYCGRDHLPQLLEDARGEPSKAEREFQSRMQAVGEMLEGQNADWDATGPIDYGIGPRKE